jgi:organic hydroperoxide reductase OsmC/OhrA
MSSTIHAEPSASTCVVYTSRVRSTGGREGGRSISEARCLDIPLSTPGTKSKGTNPEALLAASWSACFLSAMRLAAEKSKVTLGPDTSADAEIDLVLLRGRLVIRSSGMRSNMT